MRARRFASANKVFELPDGNEDNSLWVEVGILEDEAVGVAPYVRSVWVPTDEERADIALGSNVSLTTLGVGCPPIIMYVTDEPLGRPKEEG